METDSTGLPLFLYLCLLIYLILIGLVLTFGKGKTSVTARRYATVEIILLGTMFIVSYHGSIFCDKERSDCQPINGFWYLWAPTALGLSVYALVHAARLAETTKAFTIMVYVGLSLFPVSAYFAGMSKATAATLVVALFFDPFLALMKRFLTNNPIRAEYETDRSRIYQKYNKDIKAAKKRYRREGRPKGGFSNEKKELKRKRTSDLQELREQFENEERNNSPR